MNQKNCVIFGSEKLKQKIMRRRKKGTLCMFGVYWKQCVATDLDVYNAVVKFVMEEKKIVAGDEADDVAVCRWVLANIH